MRHHIRGIPLGRSLPNSKNLVQMRVTDYQIHAPRKSEACIKAQPRCSGTNYAWRNTFYIMHLRRQKWSGQKPGSVTRNKCLLGRHLVSIQPTSEVANLSRLCLRVGDVQAWLKKGPQGAPQAMEPFNHKLIIALLRHFHLGHACIKTYVFKSHTAALDKHIFWSCIYIYIYIYIYTVNIY